MAHCMETLLEEKKKKTKTSKQPGINKFRKVFYRKASHCTDNVDDKDVFHNDLHKPTRNVGKDTLETQEEEEAGEESSDQESRPDDTDTGYISRVMDMVTGTSEIVRLRQDYCREHDELLFTGKDRIRILFTGSKSEGLDLPGSDKDYMYEITSVKVVQGSHTECHPEANLLIIPSQSNSCFVLLKLVGRSLFEEFYFMNSQQIDHDILLSSLLFKLRFSNMAPDFKFLQQSTQGPSNEISTAGSSADIVHCLKCPSWPVTCDEWINRERQYNWPDDSLKRKIIQSGFHLVPVGHPLSPQREMEWRVSFSIAERELVWSFNHVQMHCYTFLKIILKEYIKPRFLQLSTHDMPLCSYFLKTLLFWAIEETKSSFWKPENLTGCFRYLLCTLQKHVFSGHLSHYFMPDFNLFGIKVKGHAQQTVIMIMDSILDLHIEGVMNKSDTFLKASLETSQSNITLQRENDVFQFIKTFSSYITDSIFNTLSVVNKFSQFKLDDIVKFLFRSNLKTEINEVLRTCMLSYLYYTNGFGIRFSANKSLYKILKICNIKDLEFDLTSTKLLHATRLLLQKDFNACLTIINHMFFSIPPYAVYLSHGKVKSEPEVVELFKNILCKDDFNMLQIFSHGIILELMFDKHQIEILPAAIQIELKYWREFYHVYISPYVYSYYLMFLCYHGLGDVKGRESALRMLIDATTDERCGTLNHHSFNIAGHCLWFLGYSDMARLMFMKSAEITSNTEAEEENSCYHYFRLLDI